MSRANSFWKGIDPAALIKKYGSPLYVYNEAILRERCREIKNFVDYPNFRVYYSVKANTNIALLKITRQEGLMADALSMGEVFINLKAGFKPSEIFFVGNSIDDDEMRYVIKNKILISVDSVSQLERYGRLNPGGKIALRFNPGVGAGFHKKTTTGGFETKFGINAEYIPEVKEIIKKYNLSLVGINQHIGSGFSDPASYVKSIENILRIAQKFKGLKFIDFGGGFKIPYKKQEGEARFDLGTLGKKLSKVMREFAKSYDPNIAFYIEPGRYVVAECGRVIGKVNCVKQNGPNKYARTDIGFNVLVRPCMYDAHHDIEIFRGGKELKSSKKERVIVTGNICESGDILTPGGRMMPQILEEDVVALADAGAYGFSMSSEYNSRGRAAEVLIKENGRVKLIRKRETLKDLLRGQ
ncbi:MAG: diaminopimelate decarboxylase [Alphaproteobacteria bacterium]|nr:diaminopimelate decarboxylase [Alphaproteobacteria bacterium]